MSHTFFIRSSVDGHLAYLHILAVQILCPLDRYSSLFEQSLAFWNGVLQAYLIPSLPQLWDRLFLQRLYLLLVEDGTYLYSKCKREPNTYMLSLLPTWL